MKLISFFAGFILSISLLTCSAITLAQENSEATDSAQAIDVYATFWPIVPGKTINDSMFWLKQAKETFSGLFSFGDINKSKHYITLSEKRLVEAYKLFTEDKDSSSAFKTLDINKEHRDEAVKLMKKAQEENRKVGELKARLVTSLENQQMVIQNLIANIPDQKEKLEEIDNELTLQISESR